MTKEELLKFIEVKLSNSKGKLTKEDLYEIGLEHRKLPKVERSWHWLLSITGGFLSAESYRNYVLKRLRKTGPDFETKNVIKTDDEKFVEQKQELNKLKQQIRDERVNLNRTLREESRIETFKAYIQEVASTYHKLPECSFKGTKAVLDTKREAVFGLSDLHLGLAFENAFNSYNYEIAKERIKRLTLDVIDYCKTFKIDTLHVCNLGDLISGIIHPTLRLDQELDVIEQTMRAGEIVAEFLNKLQEACPHVIYRSVVDNHARVMPDKHQHIEKENMNRLIDWFLAERLKDTKVVFADDNIDIGIGRIRLMNGKTLLFMHGHEDKKNSVMQDMVGLTQEVPAYILMAHYHNTATHTFQGTKVYVTGSIIGTDPYAFSHRLFGDPEQKLLVFDGVNVIDININLK